MKADTMRMIGAVLFAVPFVVMLVTIGWFVGETFGLLVLTKTVGFVVAIIAWLCVSLFLLTRSDEE